MDCLFELEEPDLSNCLRFVTHSLSCTYISLWSHRSITSPFPSNHLICSGGLLDEDHQPSSSSPSSAATLFSAYKQLAVPLDSERVVWGCNGLRVPGYAFKNERPYIVLKEAHVLTYCSHQIQRDFYQEAKIKTIVFMGCKKGEIELGSGNAISQVNMETRLKEFFEVFSKVQESPILIPEQQISSSSSSLRSTESPESSLIFAFPGASQAQPEATPLQQPEPYSMPLRRPLLRPLDSEHSAMTSALLAVLSSPSSSTHSSPTPPQFLHHLFQQPPQERVQMRRQQRRPSAFNRFGPRDQPRLMTGSRQISMMKRSILYYRRLNVFPREYYGSSGARSTATQLHHMMSERKRREKQNELFQALRSLLPPKTKKDKSAVLTTARNQMKLLQEEVRDLRKKNESLQAQLSVSPPSSSKQHTDHDHQEQITMITSSTTSRSEPPHEVLISEVAESTSDGSSRMVDLRIRVRGAECPMDALIIRLLELIRRDHRTVTLVSMEARNMIMQPLPFTYITMRLQIQGTDDEWDELSFQEAVRRVVADVAP